MEAFSPTKRQPVIFSGQPGRNRWSWTTGRRASPSTVPRPAPALVPTVLPFPSTMEAKDVLKWTETLKVHPINKKVYLSQPTKWKWMRFLFQYICRWNIFKVIFFLYGNHFWKLRTYLIENINMYFWSHKLQSFLVSFLLRINGKDIFFLVGFDLFFPWLFTSTIHIVFWIIIVLGRRSATTTYCLSHVVESDNSTTMQLKF